MEGALETAVEAAPPPSLVVATAAGAVAPVVVVPVAAEEQSPAGVVMAADLELVVAAEPIVVDIAGVLPRGHG